MTLVPKTMPGEVRENMTPMTRALATPKKTQRNDREQPDQVH
jgi:hypothetical protein